MNSNKNLVCQILTEFLDVAIHNLIKIRNIYPDAIFVRKQKYGIIVYQTVHPQLKEYITNYMQAVYHLAKEEQLTKIVVCFYDKSYKTMYEKVIFEIAPLKFSIENDTFLLDVEKTFSSFYMKLNSLTKYWCTGGKTEEVNFALQIYTKESSGIAFMENPVYQNFPWMQVTTKHSDIPDAEIIPLTSIENNCMDIQIYMEKLPVD